MARYDLSGKVALVTGGGRGIGLATARALAARGAKVVVLGLTLSDAEQGASQLPAGSALAVEGDVVDRGAMQRAVAAAVDRFGRLDVVVANAGIAMRPATLRATTTEVFERVLDVNVLGVTRTVEAALPEVVRNRGHIVVISSVYAFNNGAGQAPYAMSKAAVEQLGRALRVELARHGVGTTVAYFGFIDTPMVQQGVDRDPLAGDMMAAVPPPLRRRLAPKVAGEAIVRAIERRRPRVVRPRRWALLSVLRGVLGPLGDAAMVRNGEIQALVQKLDARVGEDQPTTA
jgi:NAD(P)-dependent dehydrogenase (short-subunit alcohol dehydrogenase family)